MGLTGQYSNRQSFRLKGEGLVYSRCVPFDDASGNRLRWWLGVTREVFYDPEKVENILAERGSAAVPQFEK